MEEINYVINLRYTFDSGVPRNFVPGGIQQIQLRTEINEIWGAVAP